MTDSSISIPNTTKLVDTVQITSDVGVVQRQVCAIGDPAVADGIVAARASNAALALADAGLVVRPMEFNLQVARGLHTGITVHRKDGFNNDIGTGTVPEDVSNEGGVYAGFPTGSPEAGQIVVAGADTGTVYYSYLASSADTDYTLGSKAIAGPGSYALGHNVWRCNYAYFVSASATAFNVSTITIRNTVTTANVFCVIPVGYSNTHCAAYTVPAGSAIYLDRIMGSVRGSTSGSLDGLFWYRETGESPRLRFAFELQFGAPYFDDIDYLSGIPAGTDLIPRIVASSVNNLSCRFSYRFIKIKS